MSSELKPCPFCGGEAKLYDAYGPYIVECGNCRAANGRFPYEKKAIEHWNTRHDHREEVIEFVRTVASGGLYSRGEALRIPRRLEATDEEIDAGLASIQ